MDKKLHFVLGLFLSLGAASAFAKGSPVVQVGEFLKFNEPAISVKFKSEEKAKEAKAAFEAIPGITLKYQEDQADRHGNFSAKEIICYIQGTSESFRLSDLASVKSKAEAYVTALRTLKETADALTRERREGQFAMGINNLEQKRDQALKVATEASRDLQETRAKLAHE